MGSIDWESVLQKIVEQTVLWAPRVLAAAAIFFLGRLGAKLARSLVRRTLVRTQVDKTLVNFCANILYTALMAFVAIASLDRLGVPTDSLVALIAAAGLAIGFALQGSLSNFAAGVMIIVFKPFRLGDTIEGAGVLGTVADIQVFSTILCTPDNRRVVVPNGSLVGGVITNFSGHDTRRVDLTASIAYGDDVERAQGILEDILAREPLVLPMPAPTVALSNLGESSVDFAVRPWCKTQDWWDCRCRVTKQIKLRFDEAGISIPFPQRDVHLHQAT